MYSITDVTDRYSADHVTSLGALPSSAPQVDEIYLINGLNDLDTSASQVMLIDGLAGAPKPFVVKPKQRAPIGTGSQMNLKRRRKSAGLSGVPAPASDLGFVKFNIPGVELDEGVESALGGLATLLTIGIGLYGLKFVASPILGLIGDTRKAFRKFD